jgi:hypothetical protein
MPSHANLGTSTEDARANHEKTLNAEHAPRSGDFFGPDAGANLRNREVNRKKTEALCEQLAAAARERGRPLTTEETALVVEGKSLPLVARKEREKTLAELEATVRVLTERLDVLEQAQKSSTPVHMAKIERR